MEEYSACKFGSAQGFYKCEYFLKLDSVQGKICREDQKVRAICQVHTISIAALFRSTICKQL